MERNRFLKNLSSDPDWVVLEDLRTRAKSALTLGILSKVVPAGMSLFALIYMFVLQIQRSKIPFPQESAFGMADFLVITLLEGLTALMFGCLTWRRARAIGLKARAYGVRRPPASIAAHILGLRSFIGGIYILVSAFF